MDGVETAFWESRSIDEHAGLIARQARRSLADPATYALSDAIVAAPFERKTRVSAWGRSYSFNACARHDLVLPPFAQFDKRAGKALANTWNFLVENVLFRDDPPGYDQFSTLRYTLEAGFGDCDDYTIAFAALLIPQGFQVHARVVSIDGQYWAHVYPRVRHGSSGWVALDPTVRGSTPGWEFSKSRAVIDFDLSHAVR